MTLQQITEASNFIKTQLTGFVPQFGIILGTGLGKLTEEIEIQYEILYTAIPHFPVATVESHAGRLLFGKLKGKDVVCMQGRFHHYEGYTMKQVTFPVRVMKLLGIERLLVSNASGGLNPDFKEGDLMIIEDHISFLLPESPLAGENIIGERFPDMSEPYEAFMIDKAVEVAKENNITNLQKGVYIGVAGPQLETKSEYRMLRMLGADAVGMSTVPEVIVARQMDIPVFGISVITDMGIPETLRKVNLDKILAIAAKAEPNMTLLIKKLIGAL